MPIILTNLSFSGHIRPSNPSPQTRKAEMGMAVSTAHAERALKLVLNDTFDDGEYELVSSDNVVFRLSARLFNALPACTMSAHDPISSDIPYMRCWLSHPSEIAAAVRIYLLLLADSLPNLPTPFPDDITPILAFMELLERWKTTRDLYAAFVPIVIHTLKLADLGWTRKYLKWCATRWAVRDNFMLDLWMVAGIVREREKEKARVERAALQEWVMNAIAVEERLQMERLQMEQS